jgi:hypothetical protein
MLWLLSFRNPPPESNSIWTDSRSPGRSSRATWSVPIRYIGTGKTALVARLDSKQLVGLVDIVEDALRPGGSAQREAALPQHVLSFFDHFMDRVFKCSNEGGASPT